MALKTYSVTVRPGASEYLDVTAEAVACIQANLPVFRMTFDNGQETEFAQGFEFRPDGGFRTLQIINPAPVPLTVQLAVWTGAFVDRRFIDTAPDGIDPITLTDIRNKAYRLEIGRTAPTTEYAVVQVYNPPDSGRLVVVRQLILTTSQTGGVYVRRWDVPEGNIHSHLPQPAYFGGPPAVVEMRQMRTETLPDGMTQAPTLFVLTLAAGIPFTVDLPTPLIMPAGTGFVIHTGQVGTNLTMMAGTIELPGG